MSTSAPDRTLPLVRDSVRAVLCGSDAFRALAAPERRALANDMVKVARYIVDAGGETAGTPINATVATGLAGDRVRDVTGDGPGTNAGTDFKTQGGAPAASAGTTAIGELVEKVDFPAFVGGLVEGVFNAIVTSSIRQMEAYSTMVANIAKSVDEYMRDNITPNQARDYLADRYPEHLEVQKKGDGAQLLPKRDPRRTPRDRGRRERGGLSQSLASADLPLPDFMKDLGLPTPIKSLDPRTVEQTLVPAARQRMAMDRQQLLATMVLMGINRLIVTDGRISASCLFEVDTRDAIYKDSTRAASFDEGPRKRERKGWGLWFAPTPRSETTTNFTVSTTNNASSEAETTMHAELSGNVDLNFRSETFPLEKMADVLQIREIEQKAPQAAPTATALAPRPPISLPPPPPLPPFPVPGAGPAPGAGGG